MQIQRYSCWEMFIPCCLIVLVMANGAEAFGQSELDQAYFGLEFTDHRDAVQISWVDPENRSARRLQVNDVVLKAGDIVFRDARELAVALKQQAPGESVRFEVTGLSDKRPRKIVVRSEMLRDVIPKRFEKDRDPDANQVLLAPVLPAESIFIAVAQDSSGELLGLRLRIYPRSSSLRNDGVLEFISVDERNRGTTQSMVWTKDTLRFPNLSEEDLVKLPTLSDRQLGQVMSTVFLEFNSDQTSHIVRMLEHVRGQRFYLRVGGRTRHATENEQRNFESALLYYRLLTENKAEQKP